jgi:ABC-2 type transport system ATP-binding protein
MEPIIDLKDLSCRYGSHEAVSHLSLRVPAGSTYAFLGTNGAGKTTTIKTLLNLLKPTQGSATVLGVPSTSLGSAQLAQIGYLSQDQKLPLDISLRALINYSRAIYPTWDDALCHRLRDILDLPLDRKLFQLSHGMKVKAALLVSLSYRPRLLVLDEPFSGLDQLVRDELIQSLIELFEQREWTMFISSHDISEVERLADWVGIIDGGKLCFSESLESLQARFRRVDVMLADGVITPAQLPDNILLPEISGPTARWTDPRFVDEPAALERIRCLLPRDARVAFSPLSLRDIFVTITRSLRLNSASSL